MKNLKSVTEVNLPFGSMLFTHQICFDGHEQTMYQYVFDGSTHFDLEQFQPTHWKHRENRIDMRNLMVSEGGATLEEADGYIKILVGRQWNRRKGKHSMTINKGDRY
tara:strand:+ start:228 stop:548 length:321 start_codon:yes stop_codon:yes gene_type:complete